MLTKKVTTWIVITDGAKGQIVVNEGPGIHLLPLTEFSSDAARQRGQDLVSDREGRSFDRNAEGRHALEPRSNPKQVEKDKFVRSVVDQIRRGSVSGSFDQLMLIASPTVLGKLRKLLRKDFGDRIVGEIAKDLTNLNARDLADHLADVGL